MKPNKKRAAPKAADGFVASILSNLRILDQTSFRDLEKKEKA